MNTLILSIVMLFATGSASLETHPTPTALNGASIEFDTDIHDFGEVEYDGTATFDFQFTNTGDEPLIISDAKRSCGCTVPSFTREPVLPGETGVIKVSYDTKRPGPINKSVTIISNASNAPTKVIRIKGHVLQAAQTGMPEKSPSAGAPTTGSGS